LFTVKTESSGTACRRTIIGVDSQSGRYPVQIQEKLNSMNALLRGEMDATSLHPVPNSPAKMRRMEIFFWHVPALPLRDFTVPYWKKS